MKKGKAFEIIVKRILMGIGFSEVYSDGLYIFNGAAGQMLQGLGNAHNADVLLDPPVQTPFYAQTRLLIECKAYGSNGSTKRNKVGLDVVRNVFGLREDVNNFNIVDKVTLKARRSQKNGVSSATRCLYQVAVASTGGFTNNAVEFAIAHRITLIEFDKMPFWDKVSKVLNGDLNKISIERELEEIADQIASRMAVAITNVGQLLFLYNDEAESVEFSQDNYYISWEKQNQPWKLVCGNREYLFQLPNNIAEKWLKYSANELERKQKAVNYKEKFFSSMIVYYRCHGSAAIKMLSIDADRLNVAKNKLEGIKLDSKNCEISD